MESTEKPPDCFSKLLMYMTNPKRLQSAASKPMVYMINPKRLQAAALHH